MPKGAPLRCGQKMIEEALKENHEKVAEFKVTKDNYKQTKSVFALLQEYEKLKFNPDDVRILKKGAELGFSENESLALTRNC